MQALRYFFVLTALFSIHAREQWTTNHANAWYAKPPWLAGRNGTKTSANEPAVWFHDVFRTNGAPYSIQEIHYIKSVTKKKK